MLSGDRADFVRKAEMAEEFVASLVKHHDPVEVEDLVKRIEVALSGKRRNIDVMCALVGSLAHDIYKGTQRKRDAWNDKDVEVVILGLSLYLRRMVEKAKEMGMKA